MSRRDTADSARRPGFAMITVLWTMTIASSIALAGALAGRASVDEARNRVETERARWAAIGCARRVQAAVDGLLRDAPSTVVRADRWRTLDALLASRTADLAPGCGLRLVAAGSRIDVNAASDTLLRSLFRTMHLADDESDRLVDALADWRDGDDVPRPDGAERDWYAAAQRPLPRNGPLADVAELRLVRGFETLDWLDSVLSAEPGRVSLATAPFTVLRALPGITDETADSLLARQTDGTPVRDAIDLADNLTAESRDALLAHYADLQRLATADPDAWILTATASSGAPPSTVVMDWRLERSGGHCVVARVRTVR